MDIPRVSVLMPAYNAVSHIREAIESILNQTYKDFEFIIINDGSTDDTERIIQSFTDPRIRYIKNAENIKLIATLNKGIGLAKGEYIVRMDADDISLPQRIEKQVAFMDSNLQVAACGSWVDAFGVKDTAIRYESKHDEIMFKMLYQIHLVHPAVIMRSGQIKSMGIQFNPEFAHAEDYDFFVRLGYTYQLANIPEVLLKYRIHTGSVSQAYREVQKHNSEIIRLNQFARLGYPVSVQLLEDFESINHHAHTGVKSSSAEIKALLEGMLKANKKTNIFDQEFLKKKLAHIWFHYCYHVTTPAVFYSSEMLSQNTKPTLLQRIKWQVKTLVK